MYGITPLIPAYGRDYRSKDAAIADLMAGKDFETPFGRYINLEQLRELGLKEVEVRYWKMMRCTVVNIEKERR